jgi:hypothetical protein
MTHHKNGSFLGGYLLECLGDAVLDLGGFRAPDWIETLRAAAEEISLGAQIVEFGRRFCGFCGFSPEEVDACVDRDLVEPGTHFGIPAESLQSTIDFHEHFLRDVFGFVVISRDVVCEVINLFFVLADQLGEGRLVSAAQAVDKNLIILRHLFFTPIRRAVACIGLQKDTSIMVIYRQRIQKIVRLFVMEGVDRVGGGGFEGLKAHRESGNNKSYEG